MKFIELFELIQTEMNWNEETTLTWFITENYNLGGMQPITMLVIGRKEKLEKFVKQQFDEDKRET